MHAIMGLIHQDRTPTPTLPCRHLRAWHGQVRAVKFPLHRPRARNAPTLWRSGSGHRRAWGAAPKVFQTIAATTAIHLQSHIPARYCRDRSRPWDPLRATSAIVQVVISFPRAQRSGAQLFRACSMDGKETIPLRHGNIVGHIAVHIGVSPASALAYKDACALGTERVCVVRLPGRNLYQGRSNRQANQNTETNAPCRRHTGLRVGEGRRVVCGIWFATFGA